MLINLPDLQFAGVLLFLGVLASTVVGPCWAALPVWVEAMRRLKAPNLERAHSWSTSRETRHLPPDELDISPPTTML